jgi:hypothetical protein
MSINVGPPAHPTESVPISRGRRRAGAALVLVLVGIGGYALGTHRSSSTTELTGRAQVGFHVASITVDGWSYGFRDSVPWISADGSYNEGGWPDCLGDGSSSPLVHFGAAPVTLPNGTSLREITYVDCRP